MRLIRIELLLLAYFCYFSGARLQQMTSCLDTLDRTLYGCSEEPKTFLAYAQRVLFLTGEYKSLQLTVATASKLEPSIQVRATMRQKLEIEEAEIRRRELLGQHGHDGTFFFFFFC